MVRVVIAASIAGCAGSSSTPSAIEPAPLRAGTLAEAVASARPGDSVVLPAGTYEAGLVLPPGVSLRGAGMSKTILDARKFAQGITMEGTGPAEVADLTIRGALDTNLLVRGASRISVRRVRATGALTGIRFQDVASGRIENVVCDENRYGIVINGGSENAVVNNTVAGNASIGISLPAGRKPVVFNNCLAGNAVGAYLGAAVQDLRLDHNVYDGPFVGKLEGHAGKRSIGDWISVSGRDGHSVRLTVAFREPSQGDYRPAGTLAWALDRNATTDWGIEELSGVKAPEQDADGSPRIGSHDAGAYEIAFAPDRPAAGNFSVRTDAGVKSAGLFAPGGRELTYLFHDLPLPSGSYAFWFPHRDFEGNPINAGTYELKTVESALDWRPLPAIGGFGGENDLGSDAPARPSAVLFDAAGRLIVGEGWSEDATNLRAVDAATGRWLWSFPGQYEVGGLALGGDGMIYLLRHAGTQGLLTRIDPRSGTVAPWKERSAGTVLLDPAARFNGLAALDGRLYATDEASNLIGYGPAVPASFSVRVALPSPSYPSADASRHRLWVITNRERLLALDPDGKVVAETAPITSPAALAARDGRLAVASRATGKIHLFDAADPHALKLLRTVGTGDGPFGPIREDRFLFQDAPSRPGSRVHLALGPKGELAVAEENRVIVFDAAGKPLWSTFRIAGQGTAPSFDDPERLFERDGRTSVRLDEAKGIWSPESYWNTPGGGTFLGRFADGEKAFGVSILAQPGQADGNLLSVRYDGTNARAVLSLGRDTKAGSFLARRDTHRDGVLDDRDTGEVFAPPPGPHPLRGANLFPTATTFLQPNGDLLILNARADSLGLLWPRHGLDADGVPVYRFADCRTIGQTPAGRQPPRSPRRDATVRLSEAVLDEDDALTALPWFQSRTGAAVGGNPTGLARFDPQGSLQWLRTLDRHGRLAGLSTAGPVTVTGVAATGEILAANRDGLGLGRFGLPPTVGDLRSSVLQHGDVRAYRGRDGRIYVQQADTAGGRIHWWRLSGEDKIITTRTTVTLSRDVADLLAARPAQPVPAGKEPPRPIVRVARLAKPLPIDGGLEKWRTAGVMPQIVMTPESAHHPIEGPRDLSAVIRLAYHDRDLYVQILRFDDAVLFDQPIERHDRQDGLELSLSDAEAGCTITATRTTDGGPVLLRRRSGGQERAVALPADRCPRSLALLANAEKVNERTIIEAVYGVDLASCPVVVSEFKIPVDEMTGEGSSEPEVRLQSGQTFRLGFRIIDSDQAGTNTQSDLTWPVVERALAVIE